MKPSDLAINEPHSKLPMFSRRKRERKQRFQARPVLGTLEIYNHYYAGSKIDETDFIHLWELVAYHLGLDAGQLRPSDRFDKELAPKPGTEMIDEIEDLTVFVRVEAEKRNKSFSSSDVCSIDDVIQLLAIRCPPSQTKAR